MLVVRIGRFAHLFFGHAMRIVLAASQLIVSKHPHVRPESRSLWRQSEKFFESLVRADLPHECEKAALSFCWLHYQMAGNTEWIVGQVVLGNNCSSQQVYDPASAPGSLIITTSMPVYTNNSGTLRFRGTVEVDHVFFTYPSVSNLRISRSDTAWHPLR